MRTLTTTVGPLTAASANNIALSQSLAGAGALTLNGSLAAGGVVKLSIPGQISIASAGNDSTLTWTITGTNWAGDPISETLAGATASAAVTSALDYATVTSIAGSKATASTVTVGTAGTGASPWLFFDEWANAELGMQFKVSGTVNYTLQFSYDDPNDYAFPTAPSAMNWDASGSPVIAQTGNLTVSSYTAAPRWARIYLNSGSGSVTGTFRQFNVNPV